MRLLRLDSDGSFDLVEFTGDEVPPYAILSHTWGADAEEVTFRDVTVGLGQHKIGYRKLIFCGKQALQDGLNYFWVDTCCIDKSSSAELTEAINSMFRWYESAAHCYVYLSDISTDGFVQHKQHVQDSNWFRRGWTLQELLAPKSVRFYTAEGTLLGSRTSLLQEIQTATRICSQALEGELLHQFSIETRLSWAEGRRTKRAEDAAYCLLGIFDVNIPLIYGEGRRKAFIRLHREIRDSLRSEDHLSHQALSDTTAGPEPFGAVGDRSPISSRAGTMSMQYEMITVQKLLDSLHYNGLEERQHHVREAQIGTYQWILYPQLDHSLSDSSFASWLSSPLETRRIYWICGKPGSGKSTIMRFIHENLVLPDHLSPWSSDNIVFRAQYFFWNPGSELQKSVIGLLRALLYQLISQLRSHRPTMVPDVIVRAKWTAACAADNATIHWTQRELQSTLKRLLGKLKTFGSVFLLIDGLDELSGAEETRDELLRYLFEMADSAHVKICLSSRPWNAFRDAFEDCPHFRLEDVTQNDIKLFIGAQLSSQTRFRHMLRFQRHDSENLMNEISQRASGVFLWVRLVVRQLLSRIRDGDGISKLSKQLHLIPDDLNCYLRQMFDSIPSERRSEASVILQIALYEDSEFATLHPLYLLDLSFLEAGQACFLLSKGFKFDSGSLTESDNLRFCLDSTLRLLNSSCMGLLECYHKGEGSSDGVYKDVGNTALATSLSKTALDGEDSELGWSDDRPERFLIAQYDLHEANILTVDFFHRTCRDFLLTSDIQTLLHEQSNGPFDVQMYLVNARICQFIALSQLPNCHHEAIELASNILSSLARPSSRDSVEGARLATLFGASFESLMHTHDADDSSASYIMASIDSWESEKSSFLTLAIDFGLHSYVRENLKMKSVREKKGRPILDYILRPRFPKMREHIKIGNTEPNLEFLRMVLTMGVHPNEMYGPSSVWALFLCFFADLLNSGLSENYVPVYVAALDVMIRAGASALLPKSWLSTKTKYDLYSYELLFQDQTYMSSRKRFLRRWLDIQPATDTFGDATEPCYAVEGLLERFRPQLGASIDELKTHLRESNI
ncbi:hypothetical protein E8E13_010761 [Curvularia kusanoi]|uniref:NACHT domain-containing protein n=1 Tax=Curvularia kusanoi TaxID=90978 RepID=A0A9P4THU2_CURKU|nr:hypothetical protein E8E13_010761 [Curvularia kusanoi]